MLFDIGDTAHIAIVFANLLGQPTNPTVVTLTIQAPDNSTSTPAPTNDSAGNYHYDLAITQSGIYRFKWQGTGTVAAVEEGEIAVKPSILVPQPPGTIIVADLIRTGLRLAGLMDQARRKASPEQLDEGVETFNEMMDFWRAQSWRVPCTSRTLFQLVPQQKIYTIGTVGADFTAPRPARILQAGLVLTNQTPNPEWPLEVLTQEAYGYIRNKDWSSSWPIAVYYEQTYTANLGTFYFYPVPSVGHSVALWLEQSITEVQGLTTGLVLPPAHRKAIVENLALAIVARNPKTARPGPTLRSDAEDSLKVIEALNYRPTTRISDVPLRHTRSNIYGGREGR